MNFTEAIVRNPVKVTVGMLLLALFGFIALFRMPMQLTPEVQTPTLTIETSWPGASAYEVEREIVQEQEKQLKGVEGMTKMTSESKDSSGSITMEFAVGTDMREALLKANTRLQQVREYPEDADEPVIKTANLGDRPIAWFILSPRPPSRDKIAAFKQQYPQLAEQLAQVENTFNEGVAYARLVRLAKTHPEFQQLLPPDIEIPKLRKFAEDVIEARFERVKGVSDSNIFGGREEEMQVIVDVEKLAARQITVNDVRDALRQQNKDTSGGDYRQGRRRYVIRTLGQFRTIKDIEDTVIKHIDDAPVYVRDVATVQKGYKKPDGLVRRFGTQRLAVNAIRESGANVIDVMDGLKAATKELNEGVLKQRQLELLQVYDETEYINSAVGLVQNNIIVGGLLTIAVLLIFLRSIRSTFVIALAIPTSIVGTFLMLYLMGRSLNVISLAGLAFAVGMLVDNAVVVLENIYRHYQLGESRFTAAVKGSKEVLGAVLASTLTTLAVFIPVLFVEEEAGQLFRDIALAISCGIALSLLVSMTLIPTATARLLAKRTPTPEDPSDNGQQTSHKTSRSFVGILLSPLSAFGNGFVHLIVDLNGWLQKSVLLRLIVVVGFALGSIALSWTLIPKVEYLPTGNRNLVFGIMLPPPGYNIDEMIGMGARIENRLRPYWDHDKESIKNYDMEFPPVGDYFFVVRGRTIFMGLRAADPQRAGELVPLVQKVASGEPGTFVIANQSSLFEQGLAASRTIDVEITGPDLKHLIKLGQEVIVDVQNVVPGCQAFPKPSLDLNSPEFHIVPKREQAAEMGMKADEIGYTVDALIDGAYATDFFVGSDKIDLRIIGKDPFPSKKGDVDMFYRETQDLDDLPIATRKGNIPVPLRALAHAFTSSGPEQVNHRERQRAITIQVSPPQKIALEDAMGRLQQQIITPMIQQGKLKGGLYQINLAGTADKLRATWDALYLNFVLAILITYLLMAALFESWVYPLVIIMSVPLGAVGGFLGLWLLNLFTFQALDVLTMLGFVILIGTVVNNPILIVEQALVHMREEQMPMDKAILESVRNRIRPIFMTTTTTLFGLIPLVLFPGSGSELYRGLGAVVLGGLLVSTVVTLIVVPAFFSLAMQLGNSVAESVGMETNEDISGSIPSDVRSDGGHPFGPHQAEGSVTSSGIRG
ncbi:MAG: efflux RND transporter permease subunit [Gemmataceae bacterium]